MKVVVLNTYDRLWGASIASIRTTESLTSVGIDAKLLCLQAVKPNDLVTSIEDTELAFPLSLLGKKNQNYLQHKYSQFLLFKEKAYLYLNDRQKGFNFGFSLSSTGRNITNYQDIKRADILHLNWTNNAFLSFDGLNRLFSLDKKNIWTLHDMWVFTGGCHYADPCINYLKNCGFCPYLKKPGEVDLSYRIWQKKRELYKKYPITFTAPSRWMASKAEESGLFKEKTNVRVISNPIDTDIFKPKTQIECRDYFKLPSEAKLILFGSAKFNDERKGFKFLYEAIQKVKKDPAYKALELVVYGFAPDKIQFPGLKVHYVGMLKSDIDLSICYNACDLLALPSVADNQPLAIMEALACGVPVLSFAIGGIPEMVETGQNGFLAPALDTDLLAKGLKEILDNSNMEEMKKTARERSLNEFSYHSVGKQWKDIYTYD